jgi:glucosamine--fructose-6-phosphate aminotransferase (isomerizing)
LVDRILAVLPRLEGQYAVVAVHRAEPGVVVAFRDGPPLVVGLGEDENLVASDVTALLHRTRKVIYLENGEVAEIRHDSICLRDREGGEIERAADVLEWDAARVEKGGYRHFMLKEIYEQPDAIRNTVRAYLDQERLGVNLDGLGFAPDELARLQRVHLVACGTSWHACLAGKFILEELTGLPTEVDYASEYRYRAPLVGDDVLVIGVTQSGETADTLAAMAMARDAGALSKILTQAGPEIGVASTKAFTTQLVAMVLIALGLRLARGLADATDASLVAELQRLPQAVERALNIDEELYRIGTEMLADATDSLYLGRGILYPIALEGALKLKEISYLHAEGYPAGEMKHGPIALLQEGFPVVAVVPDGTNRDKLVSNLMEVRARGATVLAVADESAGEMSEVADLMLTVPTVHPLLQPVVTVVPLQLLAYHVAVELGLDVDQPRNLAKSVTVE